MWRRAWGWVGDDGTPVEDPPHVAGPEACCRAGSRTPPRAARPSASRPSSQPRPQRGDGGVVDRHAPLLAALAEHRDRAAAQVDVAPVEPAQLRDPQPGRVEELEHREVAPVERASRAARRGAMPSRPRRARGAGAPARRGAQGRGPDRSRGDPAGPARRSSSAVPPPCGRWWRGRASASRGRPGSGAGAGGRPRRALDVAAGHPLGEGADVADVRLAGGRGAPAQPGRETRADPSRAARQSTVPPPLRGPGH